MVPMIHDFPAWLTNVLLISIGVAGVLLAHGVIVRVAARTAKRTATKTDDILLGRLKSPTRWLLVAFALTALQPGLALDSFGLQLWARVAGLLIPALVGWLALALLGVAADLIKARADITAADNLQARRRRTRADLLYRIGMFVVLLATFCMMLMSIPSVRNIGVTLIASAGLAALAVGAAAQPALKNLIAGVQMALTEPIRIDDVVIIEGEWGRIEEIRLTYVVVKLWDERRLIVPVSKFLEDSFQNWTRQTSQILGSVIWHLDPATDIDRLRDKLNELITSNERWDGRFYNLQVTETRPEAIEVRALMTAKDASTAFDLRCDVREGMLKFIRQQMPESLTRYRAEMRVSAATGAETRLFGETNRERTSRSEALQDR
jgi:small-conductance mechanosensitive channel